MGRTIACVPRVPLGKHTGLYAHARARVLNLALRHTRHTPRPSAEFERLHVRAEQEARFEADAWELLRWA